MFSYSTGYYVSPPVDQYLKFKNRCSLVRAPMMMGAHPQGWGRAPIKWGRALLEKGLFQKCHNES